MEKRLLAAMLLGLLMLDGVCQAQFARQSDKQIEQQVRALRKPDVAWRKIAWKTCLIDALHTAAEEKKPVIAWIFIDRPKDDERC